MIENTKVKNKKIIKIAVLILLILLINLFFASEKVLAYGTWQGNSSSGMPQKGVLSSSGSLLPNVYQKRTFSGDADTKFPYTGWTTEMKGTTMYGTDSNKAIRFGEYDSNKYYPIPYLNPNVGATYADFLLKMNKLCEERVKDYFSKFNLKDVVALAHGAFGLKYDGYIPAIAYEQLQGPTVYNNELYKFDLTKPMLITRVKSSSASSASGYDYSTAENLTREVMTLSVETKLTKWDKPVLTSDGSTNMRIVPNEVSIWNLDPVLGPKVVVMETKNRAGNGYQKEGDTKKYGNFSFGRGNANIAYILTAMENAYSGVTNSTRNKYNLSDIQTAYWQAKDYSWISTAELTQNGKSLYEKAKSYQKFVNQKLFSFGISADIDMSQAQVVSNRNNNEYIIGPVVINYPEYQDISYIKSIYLKTDEGELLKTKTLVYDENTDDFQIDILGRKVSGSNGLKKEYPASGSQFYIKFSASNTWYPKNVGVYADIEYLNNTEVEYNQLKTKAKVYQYIGYTARANESSSSKSDKKLRLARGTAVIEVNYSYTQTHIEWVGPVPVPYFTKEHGALILLIHKDDTYMMAQPFVQMAKDPVDEIEAQPIDAVMNGKREYAVYHIEYHKDKIKLPTNISSEPNRTQKNIDLTMKISGKVWVDGSVGKENNYDGKYGDGDTPMSNVKVSLYEVPKIPTPSQKPKPDLPQNKDPNEPQKPSLLSKRYLVYNRKTGETLIGKNQNSQCSIASVTKIVTALIVAERANLNDVVTVKADAVGSTLRKKTWSPELQIVGLEEGDQVTVRDLLRAVLVYSGCDAAVALADHVAGSEAAFVNLMNAKARELGATSSSFVTPYGVKAADKSSAMDLAKILDKAMDNQVFAQYFKEGSNQSITITIRRNGGSFQKKLNSTNPLKTSPGVEGTKTGYISAAGYCVIASFKYEDEEYAIVVLGLSTKEQRNSEARKLVQYLLEKIEYDKKKANKSDSTGSTGSIGDIVTGITSSLDFIEKGRFVEATTTDANGDYVFYNLNSMYNYYVKFTYNGQYYEPTKYNGKRDDTNWNINSKGMDVSSQRNVFNAKFRDIGSAPANLLEPAAEMHTRTELKNMGLIDDFGNIVGDVNKKDGTRTSKDTYVNESMMDSYTCNGTNSMDLYPNLDVFVIAERKHSLLDTSQVLKFVGNNDIKTLYANPDIMRHVNQGYIEREKVDLALRKDVYKATLEINGETEEYKYDKRNSLIYEGCWDIKGRNDLGYYNQNYTRELYREDYSYKVQDYTNWDKMQNMLGLSEDSELKVFVTYRFTIRNSSYGIATAVTEVVDYYDQDYTIVPERSYLGDKDGNSIGGIVLSDKSRYADTTNKHMEKSQYNTVYITGTNIYSNASDDISSYGCFPLSDPDKNKDVYFYVTFEVNKDSDRNILLDNDSGKENVAEINGYKSYYGIRAVAPNLGNTQALPEFKKGDIAGIPDADSTPGNLREINTSKFEDDTDKAPNIKITLNYQNVRTIKGTVWEDKRTEEINNAMVGNGKRDTGETGINGVRVQLVEIREADKGEGTDGYEYEYVWKEVKTGEQSQATTTVIPRRGKVTFSDLTSLGVGTGEYLFQGLIPGRYIVRFIYGSTDETVLSEQAVDYKTGNTINNPVTQQLGYNGQTAINKKSYNGNDYKSTSYQVESTFNGSGAYKNNTSGSYMYNYEDADGKNQSDAKDIMRNIDYSSLSSLIQSITDWKMQVAKNPLNLINSTNTREDVEKYSNGDTTNELAEILASYEKLPSSPSKAREYLNKFMNNTYMVAETGVINMKGEYNREESDTTPLVGTANVGFSNYDRGGYYVLDGLDFGLVERPKAQLKVTKQITNVKMTLSDKSVLFDAIGRATNVLWMGHTAHGQDTGNIYTTNKNYKNDFMLAPAVRTKAASKGKVQLTVDEELTHGATLQITYAITVANVGEVDYKEDQFYYTGKVADTSTIVKTNPRKLIDYVGTQLHEWDKTDDKTATRNNLQFSKELNPDWNVITEEQVLKGLVNSQYQSGIKKYTKDHIIVTEATSKDLIPIIADQANATKIANEFKENPMHALETVNQSKSVSGVQLILTQMITQDNTNDDKTYNNMTELVTTKNTVGRKMAYSIVGNQDPTIEPYEIDADSAQDVVILPPFGNTPIYYVLISAVAFILIAGITITIVILKKNNK